MAFKSAQTNFQGQQGWNDLSPDALHLTTRAQRGSKEKIRARRVVSPIISSLVSDSSPMAQGPPATPPSTTTALPNTAAGPPPLKTSFNGSQAPPPVARSSLIPPPKARNSMPSMSSQESSNVTPKEVSDSLSEVSKRPLALSTHEVETTVQKIQKQLPELDQSHLTFLSQVLEVALLPEGKAQARKMLVDYALLNSNVSTWTVPVRRLVEQQL